MATQYETHNLVTEKTNPVPFPDSPLQSATPPQPHPASSYITGLRQAEKARDLEPTWPAGRMLPPPSSGQVTAFTHCWKLDSLGGSEFFQFSVLRLDLSPPCQLSSRKTQPLPLLTQIPTWVQTRAIISTPSSITSSATSPANLSLAI